jgi:hypothetical protein
MTVQCKVALKVRLCVEDYHRRRDDQLSGGQEVGETQAADVRSRAEAMVAAIGVSEHVQWDDVIAKVEIAYGKPIRLVSVGDGRLAKLSGLWIDRESFGLIHYREEDPTFYQVHSIGHELGHILMNHEDCSVLRSIDFGRLDRSHIAGEIRRARARGLLRDEDEEIAEQIAYVLASRVLGQSTSAVEDVFG